MSSALDNPAKVDIPLYKENNPNLQMYNTRQRWVDLNSG